MNFTVNETCPRCYRPITLATIEPHPSRSDLALHNLECAVCGAVKTTLVSLQAKSAKVAS